MDKQLSDVVAWLRMLSLPRAVRWALGGVIALAVVTGFALIVAEIAWLRSGLAESGTTLLVLALPLCLLVLLLAYGRGDAQSLNQRTAELLSSTVPQAVGHLLASPAGSRSVARDASVHTVVRGFIADYTVEIAPADAAAGGRRRLELTVEVNVKKVNLVVWVPTRHTQAGAGAARAFVDAQRSVFDGAKNEGYVVHEEPALQVFGNQRRVGIVLTKTLGDEDFLIKPQARLYWAQDLAFFVQGLLRSEAFDANAA